MRFGLWFEPEMVNPGTELYKNHPDWIIHTKGRESYQVRNQYTLDLSREDVCDYIIDTLSGILSRANIEYVKWDMNRYMSEVGSSELPADRQGEVKHRYMLGLYSVLETLTQRFPNILFESCASGGGRFDAGMLYYIPQTWDERRQRRGRAASHTVRHKHCLSVFLNGRACFGGAESSDRKNNLL